MNAIYPASYEYAGLSKIYATDLGNEDYELLRQWWAEMNMEQWIPEHPFPPERLVVRTCGTPLWLVLRLVIDPRF